MEKCFSDFFGCQLSRWRIAQNNGIYKTAKSFIALWSKSQTLHIWSWCRFDNVGSSHPWTSFLHHQVDSDNSDGQMVYPMRQKRSLLHRLPSCNFYWAGKSYWRKFECCSYQGQFPISQLEVGQIVPPYSIQNSYYSFRIWSWEDFGWFCFSLLLCGEWLFTSYSMFDHQVRRYWRFDEGLWILSRYNVGLCH